MMDIISNSTPKSNKEHTCMWCNGKINKGEVYNKQVLKTDSIYTWINHLKCSRLFLDLRMCDHDEGEGVGSEEFMRHVYEFVYSRVYEEEHEGLFGEDAVNKAIELLESEG